MSITVKNILVVFIMALIIRISYVIFFVEAEYLFAEDQMGYIQLAQQFPVTGFLGVTPERMPGYPLFVATIYSIFGDWAWNVILIQILVDSISCVVIALTAQSLFNKGFWIAGILSAINLNMIILSATILTDTLFLFLFVLFLFSLLQYLRNNSLVWLFLLVLFISMTTLVRVSSYYLLPILFVWLVSWRLWQKDSIMRVSKLVALYLVVVGILLGGIHQRNYQEYGSTSLSSQTGTHILEWVVPATYQYSGQGSYQEGKDLVKEKLDLALQNDNLEALPSNIFDGSAYQAEIAKDILIEFGFINIAKAWVVGSVVNLLAPSVAYAPEFRSMKHPSFYATKGDGVVEKLFNYIKNSSGIIYLSILFVATILSILFIMLALLGVFKMAKNLPPITVTTLLLLVGYFIAVIGPVIGVKYRLPVEPILILFVTYFLNGIDSKDSH